MTLTSKEKRILRIQMESCGETLKCVAAKMTPNECDVIIVFASRSGPDTELLLVHQLETEPLIGVLQGIIDSIRARG